MRVSTGKFKGKQKYAYLVSIVRSSGGGLTLLAAGELGKIAVVVSLPAARGVSHVIPDAWR